MRAPIIKGSNFVTKQYTDAGSKLQKKLKLQKIHKLFKLQKQKIVYKQH